MKHRPCRYCHKSAQFVVSLGRMPLVNYFPKPDEAAGVRFYPLDLYYCASCGLGQTGIQVPPERIFSTYHYTTGSSAPLVRQLDALAREVRAFLPKGGSVLDIGCNDGTFLANFSSKDNRVLGVEPAQNIARLARERGIAVMERFFSFSVAKEIKNAYGSFDLITMTHALANMPDPADVLRGVATLLAPGGTLILEVASLESMIAAGQFDSIYHEHYWYCSRKALIRMLTDAGLMPIRMRRTGSQGGSTRVYAMHAANTFKRVRHEGIPPYALSRFSRLVCSFPARMKKILPSGRIIGFGAPAKATILIQYVGLGQRISYAVDSTPGKNGRFIPGTMIPIYPEDVIGRRVPDGIILFSWNYRQAIEKKLRQSIRKKSVVIVPFPVLKTTIIRPSSVDHLEPDLR